MSGSAAEAADLLTESRAPSAHSSETHSPAIHRIPQCVYSNTLLFTKRHKAVTMCTFPTLCQHFHHFRNFRTQACFTFNVFEMNPCLELLLLNFIIIFFSSLVNSLPAVSIALQSLHLSKFSINMTSRMTQRILHR